jgi:hypothetical protein
LATIAVARSVQQGRELLVWGAAVSDEAAYGVWHAARMRWIRRTLRLLALQFETEAAQEFVRASRTAGVTWQGCHTAALRATSDVIELLTALVGTLQEASNKR